MTDTPTTAPALTDEQIDQFVAGARAAFITANTDELALNAFDAGRHFNVGLAAVIARAKRDERAATVAWLRNTAAGLKDPAYGSAIGWMADRLENKGATDDETD